MVSSVPLHHNHVNIQTTRKVKQNIYRHRLYGLYGENCPGENGHSPTRAALGETTCSAFPYKTWRTVYMRDKTFAQLEGLPRSRVTLF